MAVEKMPVAILQEMMIKMGVIPIYEFCPNELKTVTPLFTFKVMCDGITTFGTGRSKREAKQKAAESMIEKMNERKIVIESSTLADSSKRAQDNKVQELMKLCDKLCLENPIFKDLGATGPPHSPVYTTQCTVSKFQQDGSARSKRQSKHNAAQKMIDQLKDTFMVDDSPKQNGNKRIKSDYKHTDDDASKKNFSEINKLYQASELKINYQLKSESKRKELLNSLGDISILLKNLERMNNLIAECQINCNNQKIVELKQRFQKSMDEAKIDFQHMLLQTADPATSMLIIQLNIVPDVIEMSIGKTREEAEWRTINKIINTLKELLN